MTNTDVGTGSKKRVSERDWIDASGEVVEKEEEATGGRYTIVHGGIKRSFDLQLGEPGKAGTMLGIFGFHTKVGNVVNSVLNNKDAPGDANDAADAVQEYLEGLERGVWGERTGVGAKVDKDALAAAFVEFAANNGKSLDIVAVRERIDDDPAWARGARANPDVAKLYAKHTGKTVKTADELLGGF